ncbi:hypothetical protein NQ315_004924, partial [Exocentrus adspersus]
LNSCEEEIEALEKEIEAMRSGNLTPDLEAQVIKKENYQLKQDLAKCDEVMNFLGLPGNRQLQFEVLKQKLVVLQETEKERDALKSRVEKLERELYAYNDLPEDIEVFKQRSLLLDEVLQDRDRLSKRVEQLRGVDEEILALRKKAARVDELEGKLKYVLREKNAAECDLEVMRCKSTSAEIDALNQKTESDTLRSKLVCVEQEVESLKCVCKEKERLKYERDHLQQNLDELLRMQGDYEHMAIQMKCMDVLKSERDLYKSKYETLIGLECECDILRTQVEKAKLIEKERDSLESQVEDLESCIVEQEDEIRRLVSHIDVLTKGQDEQQEKLKGILSSMRAELEQKDCIIRSSEEKLSLIQDQLENSIQGLSEETAMLRSRNEKLEKQMNELCYENETLKHELNKKQSVINLMSRSVSADSDHTQKVSDQLTKSIKGINAEVGKLIEHNEELEKEMYQYQNKIVDLQSELKMKQNEIDTLQEVLQDRESVLSDTPLLAKEIQTSQNASAEITNLVLENKKLQKQQSTYVKNLSALQMKLKEKDDEMKMLHMALKDYQPQIKKGETEKPQRSYKGDYVFNVMTNQFEMPGIESAIKGKGAKQAGIKMGSVSGDEHLRQMLRQSKCAIEKIALELTRQYEEWDCIKDTLRKQKEEKEKEIKRKDEIQEIREKT